MALIWSSEREVPEGQAAPKWLGYVLTAGLLLGAALFTLFIVGLVNWACSVWTQVNR